MPQMIGQGRPSAGAAEAPPARPAAVEAVKKKPLTPEPDSPSETGTVDLTAESLPALWAQTLQAVGTFLASELSKCDVPAIFGPNGLALRFPADYNQAREHCQRPSNVARLQEVLKKLTGRDWQVRIDAAPASETNAATAPEASEPPPSARPRRSPRESAEKEPLVQRALDVLGAQFVRVDEGFGTRTVALPAPDDGGPADTMPTDEE